MNKSLTFLITILCFTSTPAANANEWSRFRGPNGNGNGTGESIPVEFTDADFNFKVKLPGTTGCSSPIVWDEKVFVLSANPDNATRYVTCLHAISGEVLWKKTFASEEHHLHTRSSYASSTPTADEERVYVAWSTPTVTTFKAFYHDGKEAWSIDLGRWQSQHGFGTSPIIYKDLIILHNSQQANQLKKGQVAGDSFMMAFDRKTGEERWRKKLVSKSVCYSVPLIHSPPDGGDDELICVGTGNGMYSLNPLTGSENWVVDEGLFKMRTIGSPIEAGGLIFGSTGNGGYSGNYIVAVKPGKDAHLEYKLKNSREFKAPYVPCLVSDGELVFCMYDRGFASCIDAKSGKVHWVKRTGAALSASPVLVNDRIYCLDEKGTVWVFAASTDYELLAKNELGEDSRSTPAVANGRLYVRTNSQLFCIGGE